MPRVSKFDLLAEKEGKPLAEVLIEKLNRVRTIEKLAAEIDVTVAYTSRKLAKLGIENQPHWVIKETEDA